MLVCDHRGEGLGGPEGPGGAGGSGGPGSIGAALTAAGFVVQHSSHLRQTLEKLGRSAPAVLVLDPLTQGGAVELEAIERARQGGTATPVLMVVDAGQALPSLLRKRMLEHGAWDLVHRGAPAEEFLMRVQGLQRDSLQRAEMELLRHRAAHDDRTDLLRPHAFQDRLREHVSAAQRHRFDMALMLIDLDHFGKVNKLHDHTVGDLIISRVGSVIRNALRTEDVAGRLGGDEFAVLLPYTKKVDASSVVRRLLVEIKDLSGRVPGAKGDVEISASIGFETFDGSDLDGAQTLRLHAEEAMRYAKARGGNQGVYFRRLHAAGGSGLTDQDQP